MTAALFRFISTVITMAATPASAAVGAQATYFPLPESRGGWRMLPSVEDYAKSVQLLRV